MVSCSKAEYSNTLCYGKQSLFCNTTRLRRRFSSWKKRFQQSIKTRVCRVNQSSKKVLQSLQFTINISGIHKHLLSWKVSPIQRLSSTRRACPWSNELLTKANAWGRTLFLTVIPTVGPDLLSDIKVQQSSRARAVICKSESLINRKPMIHISLLLFCLLRNKETSLKVKYQTWSKLKVPLW